VLCTSSDLYPYADFLLERLPSLPHNIILVMGDSNVYDIDMSSFENDGYMIRIEDNNAIIAGKSSRSLDLACRYYANETLRGNIIKNTVLHEGHRVDRFELFGIPIERYAIVAGSKTDFAASEFSRLLMQACGISLSASVSQVSSPMIAIRISNDSTLGKNGFRIFESDGNLILEGASADACTSAVYSFFEEFCGWESLRFGDSCLQDNKYVSVPKCISYSESPAFEYFSTSLSDSFTTDRLVSSISSDTVTPVLGTDTRLFEKVSLPVCISSETSYKSIFLAVFTYLLSNSEDTQIDLTPLFKDGICNCDDCSVILNAENSSYAGMMIRLANRLSDDISVFRPSAVFKFLLPLSEATVPVSTPKNSVFITLDVTNSCCIHSLSDIKNHSDIAEDLRCWSEFTDNLYIRLSYDRSPLIRYPAFDTIRKDVKYLSGCNVRGVFLNVSDDPFGYQRIECQLFDRVCRDPELDDDEYDSLLCNLLKNEYGTGYLYIKEYIHDIVSSGCFHSCSTSTADSSDFSFNTSLFASSFDKYTQLFETAVSFASSSEQESRVKALSCHMYYMGCIASYLPAFYSADSSTIQVLNERYTLLRNRISEAGFGSVHRLSDNLFITVYSLLDSLSAEIPEDSTLSPSIVDNYVQSIASAYDNMSRDSFTFLFKTDSHYSADTPYSNSALNNMRFFGAMQKILPIDLYVHGGDLINGDHKTEEIARDSILGPISAMTESRTVPFFPLRGNHDDNSWAYLSSGSLPSNGIIDTNEWFDYALSGTDGIVMGNGAYGYFDHEESKIRVLLLDTSDIPYEEDSNGEFAYSSYGGHGLRNEQLNFFANALTFSDKGDDGKNWAVLVVSHVPLETLRNADSPYRFGIPDTLPRNNFAFLRILKAYQRGEVFDETMISRTNYGDGGYNVPSINDARGDFSYKVFADYTKNGPGEVIGFICGHLHTDNFANNVGHDSYVSSNNTVYPGLSDGYPYISISNGGFAIITVKRNYDGTGTVYVDRCGTSTVPYGYMIADGDNAVESIDPSVKGVTTSPTYTGSVASGKYSIVYTQNP